MEWLIIIALIIFGLGLIIIEVIFVPGTTIVGVAGLIIGGYGVYMTYVTYGNGTGNLVLGGSLFLALLSLIYAFRSNAWERFSLKDTNQSKVNDDQKQKFDVGEEGETISSVKPIGKAMFRDQMVEVRSNGDYIRENIKVRIIKIEQNRIFIEPINNSN